MDTKFAVEFLLLLEKDGELGKAFQAIKARHESEGLSGEKLEAAITKETVLLARANGYDICADDPSGLLTGFSGLPLPDEVLVRAVGGRGEQRAYYCNLAPDDATFQARYNARSYDNGCPSYEYRGGGYNQPACVACKHLQCTGLS